MTHGRRPASVSEVFSGHWPSGRMASWPIPSEVLGRLVFNEILGNSSRLQPGGDGGGGLAAQLSLASSTVAEQESS